MKKRKPKPAKRKASRDENQSAFDAVQRIIERSETPTPTRPKLKP